MKWPPQGLLSMQCLEIQLLLFLSGFRCFSHILHFSAFKCAELFQGLRKIMGKRGILFFGLQSKGQLFWLQHGRDEFLDQETYEVKNISAD